MQHTVKKLPESRHLHIDIITIMLHSNRSDPAIDLRQSFIYYTLWFWGLHTPRPYTAMICQSLEKGRGYLNNNNNNYEMRAVVIVCIITWSKKIIRFQAVMEGVERHITIRSSSNVIKLQCEVPIWPYGW